MQNVQLVNPNGVKTVSISYVDVFRYYLDPQPYENNVDTVCFHILFFVSTKNNGTMDCPPYWNSAMDTMDYLIFKLRFP